MEIVDAHHHIWRQRDLPWLQGEMQPRIFGAYDGIMRDYPIDEYLADARPSGVTRSVYVQANWPVDASEAEARWVSDVAAGSGWPHGIVAYADFRAEDVRDQLRRLAQFPLVRGIRQQFHWHENPQYRFADRADIPADPVVIRNIRHLADFNWVFELQVFSGQHRAAITLARECPEVRFVLQHAGMPEDLSPAGRAAWRSAMAELADCANVVCKLSGLGTFIHENNTAHISDIVNQSIGWFGAERCLFGSNFPIEKLWTSYAALVDAYRVALAQRPVREQEAIFALNAQRIYQLNKPVAGDRPGAGGTTRGVTMRHEIIESAFTSLIDGDARVEEVGSGFDFTEGPVWHPTENFLFFSDMPGDVRRRVDLNGQVTPVLQGTNMANGMTFDANMNLVVCEHATSSLAMYTPDGDRTVLASHFGGRELNSPNDVVVRSDGSIYFTDPGFGRMAYYGVERDEQLGFKGVYRLRPGAREPELVVDRYTFSQPNGLCFCPDESKLYINDTEQANIRVFDVTDDGALRNGRILATGIKDSTLAGLPDGMKVDALGNVWCTAPGGIWVFEPGGRIIGKIRVPKLVANFHWGGEDWRTLFMCATDSLYSVPVRIGPSVEPFMRASGLSEGTAASTGLFINPKTTAMIIQDMQNDVVIEGGAFADSGSPVHCREQNAIEHCRQLAEACRRKGIAVIHVWFRTDRGATDMTMNAPLFEGVREGEALVAGTWGAEPVNGLEAKPGDYTLIKNRMSPWECTPLETVLKSRGVDTIINTGAWTNMSVEHTARTGADRGYRMILPEDACSTMNADWHAASINYAVPQVALVTSTAEVLASL